MQRVVLRNAIKRNSVNAGQELLLSEEEFINMIKKHERSYIDNS